MAGHKALFGLGCLGIIGAIIWHLVAPDKLPQPVHFIAIGLLVAAVGVGWQLFQQPPIDIATITKPLQDQIDSLKRQLADAARSKTVANIPQTNSNSIVSGPSPPLKYTAYEKEQRLRAVDEIYTVIATQLQPTYNEGRTLIYDIYQKPSVDVQAEQQLTDYLGKVRDAFNNLNALLKKYSYFADIVQAEPAPEICTGR